MLWTTSCIDVIAILQHHFTLQCFVLILSQVAQSSIVCTNILSLLRSRLVRWDITLETVSVSDCGDSIHAVRFVIHGYLQAYSISAINPDTRLPIHNPSFCFHETYNSPVYSRFTTRALTSFPSTSSDDIPLTRPFVHCFASPHPTPCLASDLAIIDTSYPPLEPQNFPALLLFDGWFGIPFLDTDNITHVRIPQPSELLELYRLPTLLPLYPLIGSDLLRSIILHFPPCNLALRISSAIIRDVSFPYSQVFETSHLPISYCFSLRPLPTPTDWTSAYILDAETKKYCGCTSNRLKGF